MLAGLSASTQLTSEHFTAVVVGAMIVACVLVIILGRRRIKRIDRKADKAHKVVTRLRDELKRKRA